jgi:transposase
MNPRFVQANRDQMSLLPYDLRDWIPEDDFVHFVIEATEGMPVEKFDVNVRGSGDAQYHPHLMLGLLIYCYANGVFGSRRIERATYRDVAVRYLCANTHPDHDTICAFRRRNYEAFAEAFLYVLRLAREMKVLKVGTISVDGTKIKANASKDKSVCYGRAGELEEQLKADIEELLKKAEQADINEQDAQQLPEEISRREKLLAKMAKARETLQRQAKARAAAERKEYERKLAEREKRTGRRKGKIPQEPNDAPQQKEQTNLTDSDSRLMRKNKRSGYFQGYNAQASVDADGSQLILGVRVSQCASDRNELEADVRCIAEEIGTATAALADNGYACEHDVKNLEADGVNVLVSVHSEAKENHRTYDFRPSDKQKAREKKNGPYTKQWIKRMAEKMGTEDSRALYKLRKQTVEPVFGIIKQAMGFRQFLLRGIDKVELEWLLVSTAYNFRRLFNLKLCATCP